MNIIKYWYLNKSTKLQYKLSPIYITFSEIYINIYIIYSYIYQLPFLNSTNIYLDYISIYYIMYKSTISVPFLPFSINNIKSYKILLFKLILTPSINIIKNNSLNLYKKIIYTTQVTKITKGGRITKYKVIVLIGTKQNWFGVGIGKDFLIKEAIQKAFCNSLKSIYYTPSILSRLYITYKSTKLKNLSNYSNIWFPYIQASLFMSINLLTGNFLNRFKILGTNNICNLLQILLDYFYLQLPFIPKLTTFNNF